MAAAGDRVTPFLENDPALGDVDEPFAGDYLDETAVLRAARAGKRLAITPAIMPRLPEPYARYGVEHEAPCWSGPTASASSAAASTRRQQPR